MKAIVNRNCDTVKEQFESSFQQPFYDGSYHDSTGFGTAASDEASHSFSELTGHLISWCQVHGDVKNVVSRAGFDPYPHWTELYDCCKRVIQSNADLQKQFFGDYTRAKLMGDAMELLTKKYGKRVPRWWLPVMKKLRTPEAERTL